MFGIVNLGLKAIKFSLVQFKPREIDRFAYSKPLIQSSKPQHTVHMPRRHKLRMFPIRTEKRKRDLKLIDFRCDFLGCRFFIRLLVKSFIIEKGLIEKKNEKWDEKSGQKQQEKLEGVNF